jgi:FkbM family methyltransferase
VRYSRRSGWGVGIAAIQVCVKAMGPSPERKLFEALLNVRGKASDVLQFLKFCASHMDEADAQLFQDLLVLFLLDGKRDGYFVEFGATDGITLSNTFLLESEYSWRGIVAEPARCWHHALRRNRTCSLDHRCVWSNSGELLQFNETQEAEFSTIDALSKSDFFAERRKEGNRYTVETVSLRDLLRTHDAPKNIDYLSIDTEGSEFAILESFLPSHYDVHIITVEHNHTDQRSRIHGLLNSHGYSRVFDELSSWDDWYIKR